MEIKNRKSVNDKLSKYDYLAKGNDDFIEVTEWVNGEGFDVCIGDSKYFSLTHGQLEAINYLIKTLDYQKD